MIVLVGKTASGKNYIRDLLIEKDIQPVVTYTTRPMREGEVDGKTYHFLSQEDFQKKIKEGFFFESTAYQMKDKTWYYGSRFEKEDNNKVIILNPEGVDEITKAKDLNVKPVVFYIEAPDEILRERLRNRGDDMDKAELRLKIDNRDFKDIHSKVDLIIRNDGRLSAEQMVDRIMDFHDKMIKNPEPWKCPKVEQCAERGEKIKKNIEPEK